MPKLTKKITLLRGLSNSYLSELRERVRRYTKVSGKKTCWLWVGPVMKKELDKYGYTYVNSRYTSAHRLSYALLVSDFEISLHVLHKCDNPQCVNPNHLFLGTNADNIRDKARKLRGRRKLDIEKVKKIFQMNHSGMSQRAIARVFGISQGSVGDVLRGDSYSHLRPAKGHVDNRRRNK